MQAELLVSRILDDEGLTEGLGDPEARLLVEWLVERAEAIADQADSESAAWKQIEALCRRARSIRQFTSLWYHRHDQGAALQLAGAERFYWALPPQECQDPVEFLQQALRHEDEQDRAAALARQP